MKKFYLSAIGALAGFAALAQSPVVNPNPLNRTNLEPAPAHVAQMVQNRIAAKKAAAQKVQGGPVSQRISHTDVVIDQQGTALTFFIAPTFVDSTVKQDFGTPNDYVNTHAVGQTFDPASEIFVLLGQDYFAQQDAYTVDSVWVAGVYDIVTSGLTGNTGDVLRFEIVWGLPSATAATDPFRAVQFNGGTFPNQPNPYPMRPVRYAGNSANGDVGGLTWGGKITINHNLTVNDSAVANQYIGVPVNQAIPAGAKVGVSVKFIPGYTYNTGDVYFVGNGGSSTATLNSWRAFLSAASSASDDYGYFLEAADYDPNSWACPQTLVTDTRYALFTGGTAFLNELYFPAGDRGYLMDMKVTGVSTIGLNDAEGVQFTVFPNPSNGAMKVRVAEAGNYAVTLVNMVGQEVFRTAAQAMAQDVIDVQANDLPKGIYLVNVTLNGNTTVEKVTIK